MPPLEILYEDNHCLVVNKPAGMLTMGFPGAPQTLIDAARRYVKERYRKPGNVYLGVVHRLDKPVSGVVLFARTSKAARRLSEQFRQGSVEKIYWAVVEGRCSSDHGTLDDWLLKDRRAGVVRVVAPSTKGSRHAVLEFRRLATAPMPQAWMSRPPTPGRAGVTKNPTRVTLLELRPRTGRTHQLRVQLASRAMSICGDRKYGSHLVFASGIALHARGLVFEHPVRHEPIEVEAPLPPIWQDLPLPEVKDQPRSKNA